MKKLLFLFLLPLFAIAMTFNTASAKIVTSTVTAKKAPPAKHLVSPPDIVAVVVQQNNDAVPKVNAVRKEVPINVIVAVIITPPWSTTASMAKLDLRTTYYKDDGSPHDANTTNNNYSLVLQTKNNSPQNATGLVIQQSDKDDGNRQADYSVVMNISPGEAMYSMNSSPHMGATGTNFLLSEAMPAPNIAAHASTS